MLGSDETDPVRSKLRANCRLTPRRAGPVSSHLRVFPLILRLDETATSLPKFRARCHSTFGYAGLVHSRFPGASNIVKGCFRYSRVFPRLSQGSRLLSRASSRLDYALGPASNVYPAFPDLITCSPICPDYGLLPVRVGPRSIPPVGPGLRYHQARIRHTLVSLVIMDPAVA
jgi:hypothetical protein